MDSIKIMVENAMLDYDDDFYDQKPRIKKLRDKAKTFDKRDLETRRREERRARNKKKVEYFSSDKL